MPVISGWSLNRFRRLENDHAQSLSLCIQRETTYHYFNLSVFALLAVSQASLESWNGLGLVREGSKQKVKRKENFHFTMLTIQMYGFEFGLSIYVIAV